MASANFAAAQPRQQPCEQPVCAAAAWRTSTLQLTTPLPWGSLVSLPPLKVNSPAQLVLGLFPGLRVLRAARGQWLAVRAEWPAGQQLRGQGPAIELVRRCTHTSSPQKPPFQLLVTLSSPSTVAA